MTFRFDASGLQNGIEAISARADDAIAMFAETGAKKLESDAKTNAKWTDRTGHARQRLTGTVLRVSNGYRLKLAHGVEYGESLEFAHEKRYAIIDPTIRFTGTLEIMPAFKKLMDRLG